jgi:hypothetical protein
MFCFAFLSERATAGPFIPTTGTTGAIFDINGTPATTDNTNPVGTDGTYRFGFASSSGTIDVTAGTTHYHITGIDGVYLINTTATTASGAPVFDYSSNQTGTWSTDSPPSVTGYGYSNGNFGNSSTLLAMSLDANGAKSSFGDFSFTSIADPSAAALGVHARFYTGDTNTGLKTGFLIIQPGGGPNPPAGTAPAPSSVVLLGIGGLGLALMLVRSRRRLAVAV